MHKSLEKVYRRFYLHQPSFVASVADAAWEAGVKAAAEQGEATAIEQDGAGFDIYEHVTKKLLGNPQKE